MKRLASIIALLVLIGILFAYFMYNKPHRNIAGEAVSYEATVQEMVAEFTVDETKAYEKYFERVVVLSGSLTSVTVGGDELINLLLEGEAAVANCQLSSGQELHFWSDLKGKTIEIKGLFVGYDDLLEEVQFKECTYYEE
ncbi:MAG: hypothetical protein OER04_14035 [Cyclobacteriaceae bacterium]|nr:hypothetical protein [Cyclobacteriaceae bacterium]